MTAQELKNSILQYAVQGKLVPQNPADELASVLLERIKAERQQMIKDKKIKAEKSLPPITEEELPFEIPESWEWVRLGDAFNLVMGQSPDGKSVSNSTNGIEFHQGKVFFSKKYIIKSDQTTTEPSKIAEANSVLLCVRAPVGIVNITDREICIGRGLCSVKPLAKMPVEFVFYMLETYKHIFVKQATGTTFVAITGEVVKNQLIPLPPLVEQQRIVAKIEELMPLVEEYDKAEKELTELNAKFPEQIKKSILQYAIQGKLAPQSEADEPASELLKKIKAEKAQLIKEKKIKAEKPLPPITEEEIPFEIPVSWEWVKLGEIGTYRKGPFGSSLTKSMFVPKSNESVKVYEQKNAIYKNHLLGDYYIKKEYFESKMKGFEVFPNDILVSCAGTIGETYIFPDNAEKGIINQALMIMKITNKIHVDYFLMYFDYILKKTAKTASNGSAIKNIPPFEVFKNMLFPLPPLAEQKRIVEKVEQVLGVCEGLK